MCLHKILLISLKRKKPAKPKVHNAAILKFFNKAPLAANLSIIFLIRSVLIGSFFTVGLPFALFADSITFLAHAPSSGFGPLIGTNEWNHFRAACTMTRAEYDLCWLAKRSWQKHSYRPWPERRPTSKAWQRRQSGRNRKNLVLSKEMISNKLFSLSLSLPFFFYTASNNIGISCPSVFSCEQVRH